MIGKVITLRVDINLDLSGCSPFCAASGISMKLEFFDCSRLCAGVWHEDGAGLLFICVVCFVCRALG